MTTIERVLEMTNVMLGRLFVADMTISVPTMTIKGGDWELWYDNNCYYLYNKRRSIFVAHAEIDALINMKNQLCNKK